MPSYTVQQARADLARLLPTLDEIVSVRADAAELGATLQAGFRSGPLGGVPEFKAAQARLDELLSALRHGDGAGPDVKGFAPLLLDFPAEIGGEPVLLCWLEGDRDLLWYHRLDTGFAGRRRIPAMA